MFKLCLTTVLLLLANTATAEPCLKVKDINSEQDARFLAGAVRTCVDESRYEDAIQLFWAYSNFGLFDQQRVWDESAHVALQELHGWIFSGYSRDDIDALKKHIGRLRDPESAFLAETCQAVKAAGPPTYRPDYMIKRGIMPRKSDDDWLTEGFNSQFAWNKALHTINGCPVN